MSNRHETTVCSANHSASVGIIRLKVLAALYRFCAQSMRFPEKAWVTRSYIDCLIQLLEQLGADEEKTLLVELLSDQQRCLEDLQTEYTRLFITGAPHVVAPPYASVYVDRSLCGKSAEKIGLYYQNFGLQVDAQADYPDHLVHQLNFLAILVERGDAEAERDFLTTFFLPWFEQFATRVVMQTRHPFYKIMVEIILYFIKEDSEHVR